MTNTPLFSNRGLFNGVAISILLWTILLLSCTTTKTTTHKTETAQTTAASSQQDTASSYRDAVANDIDFVVTYSPYDSANDKAIRTVSNAQFLTDAHQHNSAFAWLPDHSRIISISGHIGRLSDSSGTSKASRRTDTITQVKMATTQTIAVTKSWLSTFPWWIIFVIVGVIGIGLWAYKKLI